MPTPSLVIPSAPVYNEGNLYGLNVYGTNFVPEAIPYTRATTATRTNAAGLIELTPYNLLAYSEQFDNAYWLKSNMDVVVNTINAPNETLTADTVIVNATGTQQNIRTFAPFAFNTGVYTQSIYAKKNNINFIYMELGNSYATFNLSTGALSNSGQYSTGWTFVSASSQALDGGWFRFIITSNCTVAGSYSVRVFHPMSTPGSFNYPTLGDSAYIWGAQVVEGTAALPYLRTETRLNVPRVDFSLGGCPNLLLEPQRTNLALQSSSFDNASWVKIATSITANSTTSPSGIADADTLIGNGVSGNHYATQVINMTNGLMRISLYL